MQPTSGGKIPHEAAAVTMITKRIWTYLTLTLVKTYNIQQV